MVMKVTNAHIKFQKFVKLSSYQSFFLKGAEVTCVEIASEIKKKYALDQKTCSISMFSGIFSPYNHVLAALFRK